MHLNAIVIGLCGRPHIADPAEAARLGFLEWALTLPDDRPVAGAAIEASVALHGFVASAPALAEFRELLRQAARAPAPPARRGGARGRRRLH